MAVNPVINSPIDRGIGLGTNSSIYSYAYDPTTGRTFLSGNFTTLNGVSRPYIGAYESDGSLSSWAPSMSQIVEVMVVDGSTLYIGGYFNTVNGSPRQGFAALDTSTGALLSLDPQLQQYFPYSSPPFDYGDAEINYIVVDNPNNQLHLFGNISRSQKDPGYSLKNNVRISKTSGYPNRYTLYAYYNDSETYPGGYGQAVLSGGTVYYVGNMDSLDYMGSTYSLGGFLSYNAANGTPNTSLVPTFYGSNGYVYNPSTLVVLGGIIYFFGGFDRVNGVTRRYSAAIDATSGALYSFNPTFDSTPFHVITDGTYLYVGGSFTSVNSTAMPYFAVLDTSGNLVSTKRLNQKVISYYIQSTNGGQHLQVIPNGVMQLALINVNTGIYTKKIWDTRYQSPRN
jgi:hypothetical protein